MFRKILGWTGVSVGGMITLLGCGILIFKKVFQIVLAVILICLSLATGILLPNPISAVGLVCGILMLFLPEPAVGILWIVTGLLLVAGGLILALIKSKKKKKEA